MGSVVAAQDLQGDAFQRAAAAFEAIGRNDLQRAEIEARAALALRPDSPVAVRLLMDVLARNGDVAEALRVGAQSDRTGAADADLFLSRGFLKLQASDATARADFEKAIATGKLTPDQNITARLGIAETAARAGAHADVIAILDPITSEARYDIHARRGFAFFSLNAMSEAEAAFRDAVAASSNETERVTGLKGQAQALANLSCNAAARAIALDLLSRSSTCDFDLTYLLLRVSDDVAAINAFSGACKGQMTAQTSLDAAYAAKRLNRNDEAAQYFSHAIELDRVNTTKLFDEQTTFNLRREVEALSRTFGVNGTLAYRTARPSSAGNSVGQAIVEAYWQPGNVGNQSGRILQFYARSSLNTLAAGGGAVETDSTQGAVGARYKPLGDVNMAVAAERLFKIGSGATNDWLFRAGYSASLNSDINPIRGVSPTATLYAEAGYLTNQGRTLGVIEGRYGQELKLFPTSENLRVSWFAMGAVNFDSGERRKFAIAGGPGVGLRYWFRESAYRAPASYVQLDLIYRASATKSQRAGGLVVQLGFGL